MAGVSEGPKWWERTEEPDTVWRACVTDDGLDYYVNTETNETSHVQHAVYQHGRGRAVDGPRAMDIRYYYYCHTSFFANAAAMPSSVSVCVVWRFLPAGGTSRRSS